MAKQTNAPAQNGDNPEKDAVQAASANSAAAPATVAEDQAKEAAPTVEGDDPGKNPESSVAEEPKKAKYATKAEEFAALSSSKGKKVKVKFTASPTGLLNLGYHVDQEAEFDEKQVEMLEDLGLAKRTK
nr:hypothetical protein [Allomuricauda sp.]